MTKLQDLVPEINQNEAKLLLRELLAALPVNDSGDLWLWSEVINEITPILKEFIIGDE